ncbi:MAG TPA: hypothetical protein VGI57_09245 [Usitatibacter sp.]
MNTILRTFLAMILFGAMAASAQGIAFITNMKGDIALDGNPRPTLLAELAKGQKLTLGQEAQASVMFVASGKEYSLKGPGQFLVKDAEMSAATGAAPTTRETQWHATDKVLTQVAQTSAASVRMRSIAVPTPDTEPKLLYPTHGNIATLQPTFRWRAPDGKGELVLLVAGQEKPVHSVKVSGSSYKIGAKLRPDTEYTWIVSIAGNEIGTGHFRTLPAGALAQLDKQRPSDKAEFSDRVMFALALQELGAAQDARDTWARLAQEREDLPELAAFAK